MVPSQALTLYKLPTLYKSLVMIRPTSLDESFMAIDINRCWEFNPSECPCWGCRCMSPQFNLVFIRVSNPRIGRGKQLPIPSFEIAWHKLSATSSTRMVLTETVSSDFLSLRLADISEGNPIGGLVFSTAFGQLQEIFEWTVSDKHMHLSLNYADLLSISSELYFRLAVLFQSMQTRPNGAHVLSTHL